MEGNDGAGYTVYDAEIYGLEAEPGFVPARPDYHVVKSGDTLWGICEGYFRDPYLWPKVWSYNEQITNAHWIFPGDRVRLSIRTPGTTTRRRAGRDFDSAGPTTGHQPTRNFPIFSGASPTSMKMNSNRAWKLSAGADAKVMMADMDTAYLSYDAANPPIAGERLAVFEVQRPIHDIELKGRKNNRYKKGERLGYLVEIVGEVYVENLAKKSAQAKVVDSVRPIERGYKVGELRNRFARIRPVNAQTSDVGKVVDVIDELRLVGERQFVIVNLGRSRGVEVGNVLEVVHKGDAYSAEHTLEIPYESGHPRRVLGKILVVQVEDNIALGLVVDSKREIVHGDPVELRVESMGDTEQPTTADGDRRATAKGSTKVSGSVGVKIGN